MKKFFIVVVLSALVGIPATASIYKSDHKHHARLHHHWRAALHEARSSRATRQSRIVKLGPGVLRASPNERLAFKYEKMQRIALAHHARHSKIGIN